MQEDLGRGFEIGKYLESFLRQWRLIIGTTLLCALVAGAVTFFEPKVYQAKVLIASTNVGTNITLGSTIETLSEEELGYRLGGSTARLQSYVQMVPNPSIARSVIEELGEELPEGLRTPNNLVRLVSSRVAEKSDSIEIVVRHEDQQLALAIANAWGKNYVNWVNNVYSSNTSAGALKAVQEKKKEAKDIYEKAQKQLENYISKSNLDDLTRQVEENKALVTSLSTAWTTAASTIVTNTSNAQLASFNEQLLHYQELLKQAYLDSRKINRLLTNARIMRDQIQAGGEGAARSNSLALILLKTQVFEVDQVITVIPEVATTFTNPSKLQIQADTTELTREEMLVDLEGLITTLESRQTTLNSEIEALSQQLLELRSEPSTLSADAVENPSSQIPIGEASIQAFLNLNGLDGVISAINEDVPLERTISQLENKISDLQAKLAKETDRQQELTRARDLAWQSYSNLATKQAEFEIATESLGKEVALASSAGISERNNQDVSRNIVMGALVGFLFGVSAAFIIEYWWNYRGIQPRPITLTMSKRK